ncbi:MAG: hypothetical protein ACI4DL_06450 [Lachnospiraceae bacterium]
MGEGHNENNASVIKNGGFSVSSIDYRELIIEMVEKIENRGTLEYLYTFLKLFLEKWG